METEYTIKCTNIDDIKEENWMLSMNKNEQQVWRINFGKLQLKKLETKSLKAALTEEEQEQLDRERPLDIAKRFHITIHNNTSNIIYHITNDDRSGQKGCWNMRHKNINCNPNSICYKIYTSWQNIILPKLKDGTIQTMIPQEDFGKITDCSDRIRQSTHSSRQSRSRQSLGLSQSRSIKSRQKEKLPTKKTLKKKNSINPRKTVTTNYARENGPAEDE